LYWHPIPRRQRVILWCFFTTVLFTCQAFAIQVTVATGVNDDPPYVYGDTKISDTFPGVTIEILKLIEAKFDIQFIIRKLPWTRVVAMVKDNSLDGGFHFSYKPPRKSFIVYPIPPGKKVPDPKYSISSRSYSLYRLRGQAIHWNGQQFINNTARPLNIAAVRGGSITQDIVELGHQLTAVSNDQQLPNLLLARRVDIFVALENMLDPKIKTLAPKDRVLIEKTVPPVVNKPYYIAFSKRFYGKHKEIAWNIWKTIQHIKENGALDDIYTRYSNRK